MKIEHHYFDLSPVDGVEPLPLDDARRAIMTAFSDVEVDDEAALENAQKRFEALSKYGAPESVTSIYKNPAVTRMRLSDDSLGDHFIEFDLWDCQGVMVYPKPDERRLDECKVLAHEVADALGYQLSVEVYD